MKCKGNTIRRIPVTATIWLVGLLNTIFLKSGELGTWKNYVGFFLLFLAFFETVFLFAGYVRNFSCKQVKFFFLKVLALILPFYLIYLPQLNDDSGNSPFHTLWKYILTGILIYFLGFAIYYALN